MTIANETARDDERPEGTPFRHRQLWTEEDFVGIMQGCRDGCAAEQIAARIGRTVAGMRSQLRRLLPLDERHLPAELVLPRLRQLDVDGDYDWLAAMAQRTISPWERQAQAREEQDARGFGALTDEEVLEIALAIVHSAVTAPAVVTRPISGEVRSRGLSSLLTRRATIAADSAADRLLGRTPSHWSDEAAYAWASQTPERDGRWDESDAVADWRG
ncbi:hypothetical protein [Agrococcus sp. ARC_14]|uniref:hypothetical protein n=1 Tax=Agrococcus sp. ARC_14 TaxID=2919927 RepID=UPI001F063EB0|nr:hypothetical protein [Agrococcus sp. ARC_14]MCH1883272.1 hypothetical protein [Agrococcus sp. ARC_14]